MNSQQVGSDGRSTQPSLFSPTNPTGLCEMAQLAQFCTITPYTRGKFTYKTYVTTINEFPLGGFWWSFTPT